MKILFILTALFLSLAVSPQENKSDYYLAKSKNQKSIGRGLMGAGGVCIAAGVIYVFTDGFSYNAEGSASTGGSLMIAGGALVLAAVPFLVSGSKNERKAMTLSFGVERIPVQGGNVFTRLQPSVSLKVPLGRGLK